MSLIEAVKERSAAKIKTLLAGRDAAKLMKEVDPEWKGTALYWAAASGFDEILALFLSKASAADIEAKDKNGATPLYAAAANGMKISVEQLLEAKADPGNPDNDGSTPLYIAAQKGHKEIVEVLLKSGASVDKAMTTNGCTPLYIAAQNGHKEIVEVLLKSGASVDKARTTDGATPLYIAAEKGHTEIVEVLLKSGASVDKAETTDGATPLWVAAQNGHKETVEVLLKSGASVDKAWTTNGSTPLFIAAEKGHTEIVEVLLKRGASVDKTKTDGATPLLIAAQNGHKEIVEVLLKSGASVDKALTTGGSTPLFIAAQNGHKEIVAALLHSGASVDKALTMGGSTPLYIAAQNGHKEIIEVLLKWGASVDKARTTDGTTPLIIATCRGKIDCVEVLMSFGADKAAKYSGKDSAAWAAESKFPEIQDLLTKNQWIKVVDEEKNQLLKAIKVEISSKKTLKNFRFQVSAHIPSFTGSWNFVGDDGRLIEIAEESKKSIGSILSVKLRRKVAVDSEIKSEKRTSAFSDNYELFLKGKYSVPTIREKIELPPDPISEGSFKTVYKAIWLKSEVAVTKFRVGEDQKKAIEKELQILSLFREDPNFVSIHGVTPSLYMVSELCVCDLAQKIESTESTPSFEDRLRWISGVCRGLKVLHSFNWAHCDIKPENVLIGKDKYAKLIDFGSTQEIIRSTLRTTAALGSPYFMAPEAIALDSKDLKPLSPAKRDVYSFACLVIYVFTGKNCFSDASPRDLQRKWIILWDSKKDEFPPELDAALTYCESKGMSYASVEKLKELLQDCLKTDPGYRPRIDQVKSTLTEIFNLKADALAEKLENMYDTMTRLEASSIKSRIG